MRVVNEIYDFITGGSVVTPVGVACAIAAAFLMPAFRAETFVGIVALTFVASTFEAPN
ncbi:MAG: hypothetical protein JO322_06055 [Candidatus Eremiobacteraeota bacterium]|nr:hypothetical protein [Candidatus Eremiobacteraeota bacterium]